MVLHQRIWWHIPRLDNAINRPSKLKEGVIENCTGVWYVRKCSLSLAAMNLNPKYKRKKMLNAMSIWSVVSERGFYKIFYPAFWLANESGVFWILNWVKILARFNRIGWVNKIYHKCTNTFFYVCLRTSTYFTIT